MQKPGQKATVSKADSSCSGNEQIRRYGWAKIL